MLEIRRPGVTYRAWDNVRFPLRDIDIDRTLAALNLGATSPEEFEVKPEEIADQPGSFRLVRSAAFAVDQLRPAPGRPIKLPGGRFETLHAIRGEARVTAGRNEPVRLRPGETALVPAVLDAARIDSAVESELIRVWLPTPDTRARP